MFASVAALLVVMLFFSGWRNMLITAAAPALIAVVGLAVLPALGVAVDKVLVLTNGTVAEFGPIARVMPRIAPGFAATRKQIVGRV